MTAIREILRRIRTAPRICTDMRGATAIEYGLICALIVIAMAAALGGLGGGVAGKWGDVSNKVSNAL